MVRFTVALLIKPSNSGLSIRLEYVDDVHSIHSESTASIGEEFGDRESDLPQLTSMKNEPLAVATTTTGPPGTVKARPKGEKKGMKDQDVIRKLQELCLNSDPLLIYSNMVKIGQG